MTGRWQFLGRDSLSVVPEPPRWLLTRQGQGVFRAGKAGCLAAAGGIGKTSLLCNLALCVALGKPWLGTFGVPVPGNVLLAMGEEDRGEMLRRLYRASETLGLTREERSEAAGRIMAVPLAGRTCALLSGSEGRSEETEFSREMRAALEDAGCPWSLVILDPLSRFAGYETEANNSAATRFVQSVEALTSAPGNPSVIVAHHTTKGSRGESSKGDRKRVRETDVRGASALVDGFRWVATLSEHPSDDGVLVFKVGKSNYADRGGAVRLRRRGDGALVPDGEF